MGPGTRAMGAAGVVALLVTGATLVGPPGDVGEGPPEVREPVSEVSFVCPYVGWAGGDSSQIGVLALDGVAGADAEADPITVTPLTTWESGDDENTDEHKPEFEVEKRGKPKVEALDANGPTSFAVEATGQLAAGIAAETATNANEDEYYGYASTQCSAPSQDHWLIGGSGTEDLRSTLVLSNPTDLPADVDVAIFGDEGSVDAAATEGMSVPANSQRVLLLEAAAEGAKRLAVHVTANSGQVAAAMESRETVDGFAQGLTYVPVSQASKELVIPGIPADGEKTLELFAPGAIDSIVTVSFMGENGSYQPTGESDVTVPAGRVVSVPLEGAEEPVAIRVEGDQPVTAAVRVEKSGGDGARDIAYSAATPALTAPAASLSGDLGDEYATSLVLSSTSDKRTFVVVKQLGDGGGVQNEQEIEIAAGGTTVVDLEDVEHASRPLVVVDPANAGAVYAARVLTAETDEGALVDVAPLTSVVADVEVPQVVGELPKFPDPNASPSQ